MQPFEESGYRAQIHRLRKLAMNALSLYPVSVASIDFLAHIENTTFRVQSRTGTRYLLRVHRPGYHSKEAITDELRWLEHLAGRTSFAAPVPVRSKGGALVEEGEAEGVATPRCCTLMRWIDGRFSYQADTKQFFVLGHATAELHASRNQLRLPRRRYWDSDGLVGIKPKLGSVESIEGASPRQQRIISEARRLIHRTLKQFEAKFPERLGVIHADLHFGNVLFQGKRLAMIDFDDCGYGFFGYDLAVTLLSIRGRLKRKRIRKTEAYTDALISGYTSLASWDREWDRVVQYLMGARKVAMLGWLQSRSDNPRLKAYLKKALPATVRELADEFGL
jgi:Ser/Thr protein kinase RdoA (MazF antagonist)